MLPVTTKRSVDAEARFRLVAVRAETRSDATPVLFRSRYARIPISFGLAGAIWRSSIGGVVRKAALHWL